MTDQEIEAYLRENGYAGHVCRAGRAGLLRRWREFVEEVERGYRFGLEKYRKGLDLRGVIALAGLDEEAREADERLERMLTAREVRVWESGPGAPFWDFGYPRNAAPALLADLKAEGLL